MLFNIFNDSLDEFFPVKYNGFLEYFQFFSNIRFSGKTSD
jgi:hypothetical protein